MSYSALAVTAVVAVLVVDLAVYRTRLVTRRAFWATYAIVLVFQLLMNGVLTGLAGRRRPRRGRRSRRRSPRRPPADQETGARLATRHLLALGHRTVHH